MDRDWGRRHCFGRDLAVSGTSRFLENVFYVDADIVYHRLKGGFLMTTDLSDDNHWCIRLNPDASAYQQTNKPTCIVKKLDYLCASIFEEIL
jgi:hypothetical protein